MLDRESTFADPTIVKMLKEQFVPVAIDQAYQRRQQDAEGEFYRKVASQSPRNDFNQTTQGLYTLAPDGDLLGFNNNRGPERVAQMMRTALEKYKPSQVEAIAEGRVDRRYNPVLAEGGMIVRVRAKVLDGYAPTNDPWEQIFHSAVSRDNLWISAAEHKTIASGEIPVAVQHRIAKFHLVDNTRGEPPMWDDDEVQSIHMRISEGQLTGSFELKSTDGKRSFAGDFYGRVEIDENQSVARFDLVANGQFEGEGRYTRGAPTGPFPLAVSFALADGTDVADTIPPQGSRGWIDGYMR